MRFIGNLTGISVSIVLVAVQMGLRLSFERMITVIIQHATADLWIVPQGTKSFEDPAILDEYQRFRALSVNGVIDAMPLVTGFTQWRVPGGALTPVCIIGSVAGPPGLQPWHLIEGDVAALSIPDAVAVDRDNTNRLGTTKYGAEVEIANQRARILAVTEGIRSFTTTPYVFTTPNRARSYIGMPANKAAYILLRVSPAADLETVKGQLRAKLSDVEVMTPREFGKRSRSYWLFGTGAGAALVGGALLASIVGTIIVAQTVYASTKDHLHEFATLRAIGSSGSYLCIVIVLQALISAIIGFFIAVGISYLVVRMTAETTLPVVMTPKLTAALFVFTVVMCEMSALASIIKVLRADPVTAFTR